MRRLLKRRALAALLAGISLLLAGFTVMLVRPYSTPGVLIRWVVSAEEPSSLEVLLRMQLLVRIRKYDWAVKLGDQWTQTNADNFGDVNTFLTRICLFEAGRDGKNAEEHVRRALIYRDRALPFLSDSPIGLRDLASLTIIAGDLSPHQRCVQYGNAVKLLKGAEGLIKEERAQIQREIAPRQKGDGPTEAQVVAALQRNNSDLNSVRERQQHSGCSITNARQDQGSR